jgi:hypothetical protein
MLLGAADRLKERGTQVAGSARLFFAGAGLFLIAGGVLWWANGATLVTPSLLLALAWCF